MDRLLFVDDEPFVLRALKRTFELEGFEVVTALRPADALDLLRKGPGFVVIGSDYRMPEMNGAEFLQRASDLAPQSYRLLISAVEEFHAAVDSINRGEIYRFVPKPWDRDDLLAIVRGAVDDYHLRRNYREMTALLHGKNAELSALNQNLEQKVVERTQDLIEALVTALDRRGAEAVHSRKAAAYCLRLGRELSLPDAELAILEQGALIHDVGKIAIPDSILLKKGPLAPCTSPRRTSRWRVAGPSGRRGLPRKCATRSRAARVPSSIPKSSPPSCGSLPRSGTRSEAPPLRRPRPSRRSPTSRLLS